MPKEKPVKETITAAGTEISILSYAHADDYISLTDIASYKNHTAPKDVIKKLDAYSLNNRVSRTLGRT